MKKLVIVLALFVTIASAQEPIRITYWRSLAGPRGDAQDALVRTFNQIQDDIEVEVQFQGDYTEMTQKFAAALAANTVPDVMMICDTCMPPFARDDVLTPLDDYLARPGGNDAEDFLGRVLDGGRVDGDLYIIPFAASTPILFYNPDMLAEAGFDGPPETWDEFFEMSLAVSDTFGEDVYGATLWVSAWWLQSHIWTYGGDFNDDEFNTFVDSELWLEQFDRWHNLVCEQNAARIPTSAEGGTFGDFYNQRAALMFSSTANITSIIEGAADFTPQAAFMPAGPEGNIVTTGGSGLAIPASLSDAQKDAAWTFIEFMTAPVSNVYYAINSGYMPFTEGAVEDMSTFLSNRPLNQISIDQLAFARNQAALNGAGEARSILDDALNSIFVGCQEPADVLPIAQEEIQLALEDAGLR